MENLYESSKKSAFFNFGIVPQVCIHSPVQDEYSHMYIPNEICDCGCSEWTESTMEMFKGFPVKEVHRCKECNEVRMATHKGVKSHD